MGVRNAVWSTIKWKFIKKRLGYSDDEMRTFRANPCNEKVLDKAPELQKKTIVAEVVESHGCNSEHAVGDKFYFDAAGNLLTKHGPSKICVYALNAISMQVFAAGELMLAGADPNQMRFKHAACFDVGLECGGWGRIVMEIRVVDRQKT
ncbi:MAG: hypothetical protein ABW080_15895 [Candidatus Thiodiazotropha sp.]